MPAWVWFVIAALAAGGGALLLLSDRSRTGGHRRDRRRWAEAKSWEFVDVDPVLPSRWRYGAVHQGGHGRALDLATGAVPGPGGRRLAHVFDHEQAGQVTGIVAAVRGVATLPVAIELRLPSAPLPDDAGLDSLGQVGERYAFVTSVAQARPLVTPDVARAADLVGEDVPLLWAEDTWVLATIEPGADPDRVQNLLQALVEVSVALEDAAGGADPDRGDGWSERRLRGLRRGGRGPSRRRRARGRRAGARAGAGAPPDPPRPPGGHPLRHRGRRVRARRPQQLVLGAVSGPTPRRTLVTGADTDLGRAFVRRLHAAGDELVLAGGERARPRGARERAVRTPPRGPAR